ncbi:disks large-associated protein 5 isoform X2 [Kryptolebias marmoratus]|uniref:Discs, large (Drosophila) homolog-associated protein 5 n=1 Tax=Kryptolebias marmoratus TaxID=37003 RepID=A0A3Q3AJ19_KRYMA|nr:disks large-associated protein 5 isoform X2 [Kryptolebias marmoratus]
MESLFGRLRQRDTSVSMLRVKMSRRRSRSQKENRERAVNTRRQLDKLPELETSSLNVSIATANIQEKQNIAKSAKTVAQEERMKRLERWKEQKALQKEKEKREKERKGVFKTGLYQPKDIVTFPSLPSVPPASSRPKEKKMTAAPSYSTRVTRAMKQQQQEAQKPLTLQNLNTAANRAQPAAERSTRARVAVTKPQPAAAKTSVCAGYPAVQGPARASLSRSASKTPVTRTPVAKDNPKAKAADVRTTRARAVFKSLAPPSGQAEKCKAASSTTNVAASKEPELKEHQEPEQKPCPPSPPPRPEEDMVVDQAPEKNSALQSFAPEGFVFQAPAGMSSFKFEPMTPRSADAFLTPSSSFNFQPSPELPAEPSEVAPPETPRCSPPPRTSPAVAPPTPGNPLESKHDVPYFRSEITNETDRLTMLCLLWEAKVEDESIPEEMRDRMRAAVGQARLLMKKRFNQFSGLVDDCELGRGEKVTTCTDLQGFWDMVYFQVEDVKKKFDALKEAEGRGWVEEHKPPPRQRKMVKKPPVAPPAKPAVTKAAAKSRLAAVKAAMKAKQQAAEAEKAAQAAANAETPTSQEPQPQAEAQTKETVVFDGGFFKVESPAKPPVRRSSRLSAAVPPQASPCSLLSPRRVAPRRSLALARTPVGAHASPAQTVRTPGHLHLALEQTPASKPERGTPQASQSRRDPVNASLCFSPVREVLSDEAQSAQNPTQPSEIVCMQEDSATTVSVEKEDDAPVVTITSDLTLSPRLSLSPCTTPLPVLQAPEPPSSLSFMLSPCGTPSHTPISSPVAQLPVEAQQSVCLSPDGSVIEEIPGLDFERYLQPSQRCSVSPRDVVAGEMLSPRGADVEMESPRGQPEDLLMEQEPALSAVSSVFTLPSPQVQTAESDLLLFTPDIKDRIRESVCPRDLMVFTPPSNV